VPFWLSFPLDFITLAHRVLCLFPFPGCTEVLFYLVFVTHLLPLIYCLLSPTPSNVVTKLDPLDYFSFKLSPYLHVLFLSFDCLFFLSLFTHSDLSSFPDSLIYFFPYLSSFASCCCCTQPECRSIGPLILDLTLCFI